MQPLTEDEASCANALMQHKSLRLMFATSRVEKSKGAPAFSCPMKLSIASLADVRRSSVEIHKLNICISMECEHEYARAHTLWQVPAYDATGMPFGATSVLCKTPKGHHSILQKYASVNGSVPFCACISDLWPIQLASVGCLILRTFGRW